MSIIGVLTTVAAVARAVATTLTSSSQMRKHFKEHWNNWRFKRGFRNRATPLVPKFGRPIQQSVVPRSDLLQPLIQAYERSETSGCLAWISGETGSGKSQLAELLIDLLEEKRPVPFFLDVFHSSASRGDSAPYLGLLHALQNLTRKHPDSEEVMFLQRYAASWFADVSEQTASGAVRPPSEATKLLQFSDLLCHIAEQRPLVLWIDDVHWADNATLRLLCSLLGKINGERILIVATCQTEYAALVPALDDILDTARRNKLLVEVLVGPLSTNEIKSIAALRHPNVILPVHFTDLIEEISEGNALFVDNLLSSRDTANFIATLRAGVLVPNALVVLKAALPNTLQNLIAKRFRRLTPEQRELLDQATFQGTIIDSALLATASAKNSKWVEAELLKLDEIHVLVNRVGSYPVDDGAPNVRYRFRHGLYLQYLGERIQPSAKSEYAKQMAIAHEKHNARSLPLLASSLATLYATAGLPSKEAEYLVLAAEASLDRSAFFESSLSAMKAEFRLSGLPRDGEFTLLRLRCELAAGLAAAITRGYADPAVRRHYVDARELADAAQDVRSRFRAIAGLWLHELVVANLDVAYKLALEMRKVCEAGTSEQQSIDTIQVLWAVGVTAYFQGKLHDAKEALEGGVRRYRAADHKVYAGSYPIDPGVSCRYLLGRVLWLMGKPDSALRETTAAVELAEKLGHTESRAFALASEAVVLHLRGEPRGVLRRASEVRNLGRQDLLSQYGAWATILEGWALSAQGQTEEGLSKVESGFADYRATGSRLVLPSFVAIYAECLLRSGKPKLALKALNEALVESRQQGQCYADAELLRWSGEAMLLLEIGKTGHSQAADLFEKALKTAKSQCALGFQLRAASSLASISASEAERIRACEELQQAMQAIGEGRSTYDYERARELLRSLALTNEAMIANSGSTFSSFE